MAERRVIVAVDETETSAYSFTWALTNFLRETDRVLILNSQAVATGDGLSAIDIASSGEAAVPASLITDVDEERKLSDSAKVLVDKYMKQCAAVKISSEGEIVKGDPGIHICEEAKRISADVIVVGSHGHGVIIRALLGSISDYVLHHSTVPVIVVKSPQGNGAYEPLVHSGLCHNIVVAVDRSDESAYAFKWAIQNVCTGADKVTILYVNQAYASSPSAIGVDQFGGEEMFIPPEMTEKQEVEVLGQSEALVEHYMKYAAANSKVHCEGKVVSGPTEEAVVQEVTKLRADLVVVGTHNSSVIKKAVVGSVSDYLVHNSPCPVAVVKMPQGGEAPTMKAE